MSIKKVPALNLNDYLSSNLKVRQRFVYALYDSFKEYGFVVLNNHTISHELLNKAYKIQAELFALPTEEKNKYYLNNGGQRGYTPFATENAKDSPVKDLKEFWHIGRENVIANVWPPQVPEFQETFDKIVSELDKAGNLILEALGESLGCPPKFLSGIVKDGNSVLRLLHYPPVPEGVDPRQVRAGAHTDINLITLLVSGTTSGLELLDKDKQWIPVESATNAIVVNMGDMLSRMCNFNLPSTIHRVVNPDPTKNVSRLSMPYFIHPRSDIELGLIPKFKHETPRLPLTTAGEYLDERLREIGLKK